jgi:4-amino-4-deoxychorismate lyase
MILINGEQTDRINVLDRGLQYGDGLFETIACRHGQLELFDLHLARLQLGCQRLNIATDFWPDLTAQLQQLSNHSNQNLIIKVIVTRGVGGRGYRAATDSKPSWIISTHPYPDYPEQNSQGITARLCEQTVAESKNLAGLKHLNRLEQVLARNEWSDLKIAEGLMFNLRDELIEGTMSNVFAVLDNSLLTPDLSLAGVAGVMREHVIATAKKLGIRVKQTVIRKQQLAEFDELFVTNSIIKIWPVIKLDTIDYPHGHITQQIQAAIRCVCD